MNHPGIKRAERGDMLVVGIGVALVVILLVVVMGLFFSRSQVMTPPQPLQTAPPAATVPLQTQQVDQTDDAEAPVAEEPAEE